jgi:hypothetical protein
MGRLREELERYLHDPESLARLIAEAKASCFQFDD